MAAEASWEEIRAAVDELQTRGILFQLRGQCLRHCQFVHPHHNHEDARIFAAVRGFAARLGAVVDKLDADHRQVSKLLDTVAIASQRLGDLDRARQILAEVLEDLSRHLLDHLTYEEEALAPVFAAWEDWPHHP